MQISMKTLEAKSIVKGRDLQARAPSEYPRGLQNLNCGWDNGARTNQSCLHRQNGLH